MPNDTTLNNPTAAAFADVAGQDEAKKRLGALVDLHKRTKTVLGNILLVAPDGSGKTIIARATARALGVNIREVEASSIERDGDLAMIVADLETGDLLLVKHLERIRKSILNMLIKVMRTFDLDIIVGKGAVSRTMKLAVKRFACFGTVATESECPRELVPVFDSVIRLQPYQLSDMVTPAIRALTRINLTVESPTVPIIAKLSGLHPAKVESIVGRLASIGKSKLTHQEADEVLSAYGYVGQVRASAITEEISNLMELSGVQFERAMVGLLETMGFRASMTKATGDGVIDIEAILDEPVVGGLYLVQCKRFAMESLVGSPTVREFYGALTARRRAIKGILITTSGFTAQALEFAEGLPIELIDGSHLADLISRYQPAEDKQA